MSFRARATLSLLADENDALAKEIDPSGFCYAVLQTLRQGEEFSEQDFQAFVQRGKAGLRQAQPQEEIRAVAELPPPRRRRRGPPPIGPGGIRYAGTEDEEEAMAEARRVGAVEGQEGVYGDDEDEDEGEYLPVRRSRTPRQASADTITLTASQLQGMLAEATRRAILATASTPQTPAAPVEVDEEPDDDDVLGEEVAVTLDEEPVPAHQVEEADAADAADAEAPQARGRDGSGRYSPSRSKR
jgi:hypothetical protein